jgi:hypothetical protein
MLTICFTNMNSNKNYSICLLMVKSKGEELMQMLYNRALNSACSVDAGPLYRTLYKFVIHFRRWNIRTDEQTHGWTRFHHLCSAGSVSHAYNAQYM